MLHQAVAEFSTGCRRASPLTDAAKDVGCGHLLLPGGSSEGLAILHTQIDSNPNQACFANADASSRTRMEEFFDGQHLGTTKAAKKLIEGQVTATNQILDIQDKGPTLTLKKH